MKTNDMPKDATLGELESIVKFLNKEEPGWRAWHVEINKNKKKSKR